MFLIFFFKKIRTAMSSNEVDIMMVKQEPAGAIKSYKICLDAYRESFDKYISKHEFALNRIDVEHSMPYIVKTDPQAVHNGLSLQ